MVNKDFECVPRHSWEAGNDFASKEATRWIPVTRLSKDGARVGLSENGSWLVETSEGLRPVSAGGDLVWLLPRLESSEAGAVAKLSDALIRLGIPRRFVEEVPLRSAARAALNSGSAYWEHLALAWIADWSCDEKAIPLLQSLANRRSAPQNNRHLAMKILNKWRNGK